MYFLVNIQHTKDGSFPSSIQPYTDLNEAKSAYHSTLASNYAAGLLGFSAVLLNQYGNTIAQEFFESEPSILTEEG